MKGFCFASHRIRRCFFSIPSLLLQTPTPCATYKLLSTQSWLFNPGKPLMKWPFAPPPQPPQLRPPPPPPPPPQPQNPNGFTTIRDLLRDPSLSPGPSLEQALDRVGIELDEALFLHIFSHFDSSHKPLLALFLWAEKQPWYSFSVAVFNAMINALGKGRDFDTAWSLIRDRISSPDAGPNLDTFTIMVRRYARAGMNSAAIRTFEFSSTLDFIRSLDSANTLFEILLDSLCKEGHVRVASEYFERQKGRDPSWIPSTRIYNILLNGWFRSRKLKKAEGLWVEMRKENIMPSVVTYGTLVEGYCRMRRVEIAMELISDMSKEGIQPNAIVYNPIIDALGEAGRFKEALGMMERLTVVESGPTISTYNSLVKGFCKAGDLLGASKILKMMINRGFTPTPTTYNYFFRYFSKFGRIEEGLNLYTKMIESGYEPDRLTYHLLVKMLCEEEKLELAMRVIREMRARGWDLDLATSSMLIHLLCKMHRLDEAIKEFEDMIRRGIVPQYLTYQRMIDNLKKEGMNEKVKKLCDMMASLPHSKKLPNTYTEVGDSSPVRRKSIIQKAEAMSETLKTCANPRKLAKRRHQLQNAMPSANPSIDSIKSRVN
ncbi:pentatricopeptide repeat-containing protein At5g11310, mitochondrial [Ipomoea triloba]|uniref:pentatricopeptide repeat-containing protein At5g11310, mitochondrial n=1 Tax=Ipomoea triloba TaxID=35885 RepID=UPI00125E6D33|nr:pentatricopeptide repeat-containing protein At5g11310, mitochondrial [Ipomoea triloba]XP_031098325.1 pentatricopeptide repeat-containing protein At5g11310, mitochondrial [Ipomoea triloba]XP_031098330.1 pentatricopeptide repeat-containing protein At5g11310, mitochondrial [Ipomoea triloba]